MIRDVAVLYVDSRGPYPKLVEHWYDEARDARNYAGPFPVVAHPPCGPWSSLRHLHTKPEEKALALRAIEQVREFGGVLEHPSTSMLFGSHLPKPRERADGWGGVTVEVNQCDWGHPARKRTRLYIVGATHLPAMPLPKQPTHWCSGVHTPGARGETPPGIKVCSAQQRRRTPFAFALWLIRLARSAGRARGAA